MSTSHRADSTDAARLSMVLLYKQLMKATPRSRGFKIVGADGITVSSFPAQQMRCDAGVRQQGGSPRGEQQRGVPNAAQRRAANRAAERAGQPPPHPRPDARGEPAGRQDRAAPEPEQHALDPGAEAWPRVPRADALWLPPAPQHVPAQGQVEAPPVQPAQIAALPSAQPPTPSLDQAPPHAPAPGAAPVPAALPDASEALLAARAACQSSIRNGGRRSSRREAEAC